MPRHSRPLSTRLAVTIALLPAVPCLAQERPGRPEQAICADGPYVWIRETVAELIRVDPLVDGPGLTRKNLPADDLFTSSLDVQVGDPTPARFQVELRREHPTPSAVWKVPERLLVTSDLEGNFEALVRILRSQGAVDENLNWTFGEGHLVVLGDSVDRGNYATQCLWLIYKLEAEAAAAGGAAHMILGNHEAMNLAGDDRYLAPKVHWLLRETGLTIEQLFSADSELGRWLRSKNSIEKIGDQLFVHGGISPQVLDRGFGMDEINQLLRQSLGLPDPSGDSGFLMTSPGPLWYRGLVEEDDDEPKASTEHVQLVLDHFEAKQIVVGHTIVDTISTDFDGRVLRVDLKHPKSQEQGVAKALLVENGHCLVVGDDGSREPVESAER